jgi:hypothetical protein
MKTPSLLIAAGLLALPASGQPPSSTAAHTETAPQPQAPRPARFDLDFPGGKPADLAAAIEHALGRPVNLIIPPAASDVQIPPIRVRGSTLTGLFIALSQSNGRTIPISSGRTVSYQVVQYEFAPAGGNPDKDDAVWYLHYNGPTTNAPSCQFYLLTDYLNAGLTVDDITTAVQTAWKMMGPFQGEEQAPQVSFHNGTEELIFTQAGRIAPDAARP